MDERNCAKVNNTKSLIENAYVRSFSGFKDFIPLPKHEVFIENAVGLSCDTESTLHLILTCAWKMLSRKSYIDQNREACHCDSSYIKR